MNVLFVSAEVYPFAKTGGLADVAGALPPALSEIVDWIGVVMPKHRQVKGETIPWKSLSMEHAGKEYKVNVEKGELQGGVEVFFMDIPKLFDRDRLYGEPDDLLRYSLFSRFPLEFMKLLNKRINVIHINDWMAGFLPLFLKVVYKRLRTSAFANLATVFTTHNMGHQGTFPLEDFKSTGLPEDLINDENIIQDGELNMMKAALNHCHMFTTVSPTYAKEILSPEFAMGLDETLNRRKEYLVGILNGLDYDVWDPSTDKHLTDKFSQQNIIQKADAKAAIQKEAGLPQDPNVPIFGVVTRLAVQKGLDIFQECLDEIMKKNIQIILLGTGHEDVNQEMRELAPKYPNAAFLIKYDEGLAHRIYAGSDFFLVPSRFEPCGLTQLISFRYGALPVVRSTGGLADTVTDADKDPENGSGFVFYDYSAEALKDAIFRAIKCYGNAERFKEIQTRIMGLEFSWSRSARAYMDVYSKALGR